MGKKPGGSQAASNGDSAIRALEVLERQAIEVLRRFGQRSEPGRDVQSMTVGDEHLGYYAVPEDRMDLFRILQMGLTYLAYAKELRATAEQVLISGDADRLLYAALFGTRCVTTVEYLTSDTWRKSEESKRARSRGGKKTKKLTSPEHIILLESTFNQNRGKKACCKKTADQLRDDHKINVCAKTVAARLKELGIR